MQTRWIQIFCLCTTLGTTYGIRAEEALPQGTRVIATDFDSPLAISPGGAQLAYRHEGALLLYEFGDGTLEHLESVESLYQLIKDPAVDLVEVSFDAATSGEPGKPLSPQEAEWRFEKKRSPRSSVSSSFLAENTAASKFVLATSDLGTRTSRLELLDLDYQTHRIAEFDYGTSLHVLGFANNDKELVLLSKKRLLSIPLPD